MNRIGKKAVKSGLFYTIANFLIKGLTFITTPFFTRLLTQEQYGDYSNFVSWLNIATIVVTLNTESTLLSARYDYKKNFDQYILSILSMSTLSAVIWIIVCIIFLDDFSNILAMNPTHIYLILIYLVFLTAVNLYQARERYMFRYKMTVILSVLIAVSSTSLSILLVLCLNDKLSGRIIGSIVPTIIIGLFIYINILRKGKRIDISCWWYAIKICIPYIPHLLSLTLLNSIDRVMIKQFCGSEDTALYSLAYSCGALVTILISSINGAYAPWLGEKLAQKDYKSIRKISKIFVVIFSYISFSIMLFAPELLSILGGSKYIAAVYVMPPVAMGCLCQFIYTLYVSVEQFKKKVVGMAFASVSAAILNLILNTIFIPRYGYIAAAYTTLLGYIWLLVMHMIFVKKLGLSKVYSNQFVFICLSVIFVLSLLSNLLFYNTLIRYIVIFIYISMCIFALINKNKILTK